MKNVRFHVDKYRVRKVWFWIGLVLTFLLLATGFFYCSTPEQKNTPKLISVGICGEVRHKAVYHVTEGTDLAQLIRIAAGLTFNADIRLLDLDKVVLNDTIYHIPGRSYPEGKSRITEFTRALSRPYKLNTDPVVNPDKDIRQINILYVGFPAVYMLINYYPDQKRVSIIHIPHSTLFLNNDSRLIDIFFMLGIKPTIRILETSLQMRINYYLIQDRFSFIELVNMLDGIDLPIDGPFAEAYNLKPGNNHVDGFYTWEYIRFIDAKRIGRKLTSGKGMDLTRNDNFTIPPKNLQLAYELRQYRQRNVMNSMRHAYSKVNATQQLAIINNIVKTFETDISKELVLNLYKDILSTPQFSFATLPGYYSEETDKLYFYPDIPGFQLLKKQEIRKYLGIKEGKSQTIY